MPQDCGAAVPHMEANGFNTPGMPKTCARRGCYVVIYLVAQPTHRTYRAAMKHFLECCSLYMIFNPFPLSEKLLCYYAVFLTKRGLAHQIIKTYMSATRNMHISLGFLDPCNSSSPNTVTHTGWGIQRIQATKGSPSKQVRLPITPAILNRLRIHREATKHKERLVLCRIFPSRRAPSIFESAGKGARLFAVGRHHSRQCSDAANAVGSARGSSLGGGRMGQLSYPALPCMPLLL